MNTHIYECASCSVEFTHQPTRDAEQVMWIGDNAATFCSPACLEAAAERQATS